MFKPRNTLLLWLDSDDMRVLVPFGWLSYCKTVMKDRNLLLVREQVVHAMGSQCSLLIIIIIVGFI